MGNRRLERCLIRLAQILAEIHREVCQIFQNDDIILCSQLTDDSQFFIFQANPTGIIRI